HYRLGSAAAERLVGCNPPVLTHRYVAVAPAQVMAGRQLVDALEDRRLTRRIQKRQEVIERGGVEPRIDGTRREQRLDLAAEVQPSATLGVVQGLLAGAVARQQQRPRRLIPQGDAEH